MNVEQKSAGKKNVELIFEKLHLIRKPKFWIFNSTAVIFHSTYYPIFESCKSLIRHFSKI